MSEWLTNPVKLAIKFPLDRNVAACGRWGAQGGEHRRERGVAHGERGPAWARIDGTRDRAVADL